MATGRADEAVRPSQPFQVVEAVRISREPSLKLPKGPRVVDAGEGSLHPSSIRLSPVKWIAKKTLMDYNRQDCEALGLVSHQLAKLNPATPPAGKSLKGELILTSDMKPEGLRLFKRNRFVFPDME